MPTPLVKHIYALFAFVCLSTWASEQPLRHPETACGLYFSRNSETHGQKIAELYDEQGIQDAISTMNLDGETDKLHLVGVPFGGKTYKDREVEVREQLSKLGYEGLPVSSIRRLSKLVDQLTGVFFEAADGSIEKVSDLDPKNISEALAEQRENGTYIVAGTPLFGRKKTDINKALKQHKQTANVKTVSKSRLNWEIGKLKPRRALTDTKDQIRYFFPIKEDFIPRTQQETKSAFQKILVPGVITFSALLGQGRDLTILIAVTAVNAANSFSIGAARSSFGNWYRRSTTAFPGMWMKNVLISSFFTATIYWAKSGSLENLKDAVTIAGWQNLLSTKWLSVLFTTAWRTPMNTAVFRWERYRGEKNEANSLEARHAGSAIEKYTSYMMTQFFIYSIVAKSSLLKIAYSASQGLHLGGDTSDPSTKVLLDMNIGHIVMASVGATAVIMMNKFKLLDKVAGIAIRLDNLESRLLNTLKKPFSWLRKFFKSKPLADQSSVENSLSPNTGESDVTED